GQARGQECVPHELALRDDDHGLICWGCVTVACALSVVPWVRKTSLMSSREYMFQDPVAPSTTHATGANVSHTQFAKTQPTLNERLTVIVASWLPRTKRSVGGWSLSSHRPAPKARVSVHE